MFLIYPRDFYHLIQPISYTINTKQICRRNTAITYNFLFDLEFYYTDMYVIYTIEDIEFLQNIEINPHNFFYPFQKKIFTHYKVEINSFVLKIL